MDLLSLLEHRRTMRAGSHRITSIDRRRNGSRAEAGQRARASLLSKNDKKDDVTHVTSDDQSCKAKLEVQLGASESLKEVGNVGQKRLKVSRDKPTSSEGLCELVDVVSSDNVQYLWNILNLRH